MTRKLTPLSNCNISTRSIFRANSKLIAHLRLPPSEGELLGTWHKKRNLHAEHAAVKRHDHQDLPDAISIAPNQPITQIARQKQANREFFTNLLSSAATKRDAKAYINRLTGLSQTQSKSRTTRSPRPRVNLGGLFRSARSVEQSPTFSQYEIRQQGFDDSDTLHVALVKLCDVDAISDQVLTGVAETLTQLARLSMSPCVILEASEGLSQEARRKLKLQAERISTAIGPLDTYARVVEEIFTVSEGGQVLPSLSLRNQLRMPLRRGLIPVVIPTAYSEKEERIVLVSADEAILTLTKELAEIANRQSNAGSDIPPNQVALDRIIVIDSSGGVPNPRSADGNHVFLNLEQEYATVMDQLNQRNTPDAQRQLRSLNMLRQALQQLPHTASGLMATAEEAANIVNENHDDSISSVGTRRQKNTLIHNLLTDKPAFSSSLPKGRLTRNVSEIPLPSKATFIKHGLPLTILPDPVSHPWTPAGPRIRLTDPQIDLERLVYLIDDSFNRRLDLENYLKRVNDRMAGVIITGDYEGGAILTWETPPGADPSDSTRLVPYLDKFAVLKKSQGAGGVADVVFNAMVRTCFPKGVCWRSRKDNPVNKWYFERSTGTKKFSDMNWTMFWTTPGVVNDRQRFMDYEAVCRGVEPTWLDKKLAAD